MKVTQEILPDSQVGLEIEIGPDVTQKTYDQTVRKFMRTARIPGFRKGKVPPQVVIQRFGRTQLKAAALEELVQNTIDQAIEREKIDAIGNYQLKSSFEKLVESYEPGQILTFSATVDVPPRVTLTAYKELTVQAEEVKSDPAKVENVLADYQQNLATLVPVEDRAAQSGDIAVVDFVGKLTKDEGEPEEFPGGSAEDFQIEIEPGRFIEGFVEGLVGMEPDTVKELSLSFPESYPQEDLAGKPVVFTITLKELKEKELPDLDDDFAQEVSEFETLEELRASLEKRYTEEAENQTKVNRDTALLDALVENLEAELPVTLVQREVDHLVTQTAMQLGNQGLDIKKFLTKEIVENMRERAKPDAIARLQRTLALGEVAKQESIELEAEAIESRKAEILADIEDVQDIDMDRLNEIVREDLLKDKILDWLAGQNTVEYVPEGTLSVDESDEADATDASDAAVEPAADDAQSDPSQATLDAVAETVESEAIASPDSAASESDEVKAD
ncbi:MAG: trigger factor [Cyanobacteria bacterium P01_D01_bin.128]